jgi:hypothetical protein
MAIEAVQGKRESVRAAATIYRLKKTTLYARLHGRPVRQDSPVNSKILTLLEEDTIV